MAEDEKVVSEALKAAASIVDKVPIYEDAIQPAAKEVGKALEIVAKAVTTALAPVEGMIWGVEHIRAFVRERVAAKLVNVPPEEIQAPRPHIGVPAIDALRYTGAEPDLAELYANLLATSMDRVTAYRAHPGFVDIIKNMAPDEARIMRFLAIRYYYPVIDIRAVNPKNRSFQVRARYVSLLGVEAACQFPTLSANYIDNLVRLGLVRVEESIRITGDEVYKPIEEHAEVKAIIEKIKADTSSAPDGEKCNPDIQKMRLAVTDLGKQFIRACVLPKEKQPRS